MMGKGHRPHGELEIRFFLDFLRDAKGGTDQETDAGCAGKLHILQLFGKGFYFF